MAQSSKAFVAPGDFTLIWAALLIITVSALAIYQLYSFLAQGCQVVAVTLLRSTTCHLFCEMTDDIFDFHSCKIPANHIFGFAMR